MTTAAPWGQSPSSLFASALQFALRNHIMPGKLKRPARRALERLGARDVRDVQRNGIKMRCHVADNATERTFALRPERPKPELTTIIDSLRPGDVFVDVGANAGLFTLHAARKVGPTGRVVAIEPLPIMLDRLRFNIRANRFENVSVVPSAVGDEPGSLLIHICERQHGQSSAIAPIENGVPITVGVDTLAAVITAQGLEKVDALKIDIEGYEDRALLPMVRTLPRALWPRRIMIEHRHAHLWREDCIASLCAVGYVKAWAGEYDVMLALDAVNLPQGG
jgi:FkbM family methyltransferase